MNSVAICLIGLGIVLIIIVLILACTTDTFKDLFTNKKLKFQAPLSLTKLRSSPKGKITVTPSGKLSDEEHKEKDLLAENPELCKQLDDLCGDESDKNQIIKDVNFLSMPSFFYADEKWPGCLPRPLYQGTCGSCWGFATVTCLASRFYIESCGNTGCDNYPQLNFGSLNQVYSNLNENYKFRKIFLDDIVKFIDTDQDQKITRKEWVDIARKNRKKLWKNEVSADEKHLIVQILVYMLDFQSLGSVNLGSENDVIKRAEKTYKVWIKFIKGNVSDGIDIKKLKEYWNSEPLNLSAEKLVACCIDCIEIDFQQQAMKDKVVREHSGEIIENPMCMGGTLDDAWILLRDTGTTTTLCIGYNMDRWAAGDHVPSCREVQGPFYGFCTGYVFKQIVEGSDSAVEMRQAVETYEKSGKHPVAIGPEDQVPWVDPQLFRFRAKNAYNLPNDVTAVQREIIERGPVTTGFKVYSDFQYIFGQEGMGGQKYNHKNPLGGHAEALIYMRDPKKSDNQAIGGHAITIVGWGTYHHRVGAKVYKIPYWICLNSWGVEWGHSGFPDYDNRNGLPNDMTQGGYFWMIRGINNCELEDNFTAGQPNIENITYPGMIDKYGWGLPGPDPDKTDFLKPLDTDRLELGPSGDRLAIFPAKEGGGTYVDYVTNDESGGTWEMKSMDPPSPYVMFWPRFRPLFCIGRTGNALGDTLSDNLIKIKKRTRIFLQKIQSIVPNPLLIIDSDEKQEQIQLDSIGSNDIKVTRAVNYNELQSHNKDVLIKVFPYHNLDMEFLQSNGFTQCSMFN